MFLSQWNATCLVLKSQRIWSRICALENQATIRLFFSLSPSLSRLSGHSGLADLSFCIPPITELSAEQTRETQWKLLSAYFSVHNASVLSSSKHVTIYILNKKDNLKSKAFCSFSNTYYADLTTLAAREKERDTVRAVCVMPCSVWSTEGAKGTFMASLLLQNTLTHPSSSSSTPINPSSNKPPLFWPQISCLLSVHMQCGHVKQNGPDPRSETCLLYHVPLKWAPQWSLLEILNFKYRNIFKWALESIRSKWMWPFYIYLWWLFRLESQTHTVSHTSKKNRQPVGWCNRSLGGFIDGIQQECFQFSNALPSGEQMS